MGRLADPVKIIIGLAALISLCHAQSGLDAVDYINEVEKEVMEISQTAVLNFMNSCALVASCEGNCSRQACVPLQGDEAGYACKHVALNPNCFSVNGAQGCSQLRVSLTKSFVRLPTGPNVTLTDEANTTICSQRMLDPIFMNISSSHNSALNLTSWTYFASVEGVHRAFPGRDVAGNNCTFEPRKRPWYMGVTAVKKDVVVLLDAGNSMGDTLPGDLLVTTSTTKFEALVSMLTSFLDTLAIGDRITIVMFTSSAAASSVLSPMTVNATNLQDLKNALQPLVPDSIQGASNLTAGFVKANQIYQNSIALKVTLTFTDGQVDAVSSGVSANGTTTTVFDSIRNLNVLVQIYSFDRLSSGSNPLSQLACDCYGTYEKISKTVANPLWTLRSYFGVLARIRLTAVNNTPAWTAPYQDNGSLGKVITVVYPAFADNYTLIGVAGIDVLIEELGSIVQSDFSTALLSYSNTDSLTGLMPPQLPCNMSYSAANQCFNVKAPKNPLCLTNDTSGLSFKQRVCKCPGVCLAWLNRRRTSLNAAEIGGIGIGVGMGLTLFSALFWFGYLRRRINHPLFGEEEAPNTLHRATTSNSPRNVGSFPSSPTGMRSQGWSLRANSGGWGSQARRALIEYTKQELSDATYNWSDSAELGRGAHGLVYKGIFANGTVAAIKKPSRGDVAGTCGGDQGWATFATELELLSKLNHKRLVRLLGYCKDEIILVYEFMENGTLADWLHSSSPTGEGGPDTPSSSKRLLGWEARLKIAMGAAKGLEYLHEYAVPKIYHGDVKPANILLDAEMESHVSDFGLSLWSRDESKNASSYLMASRMGGTFGYLDPEFVSSGQVTFASDVYSFGIVLLELMSGRRVVVDFQNIRDWAAKLQEEGDLEAVLDPSLDVTAVVQDANSLSGTNKGDNSDLLEVVRIALRCVERKKQDRPKMKEVASSLDHAWNLWLRRSRASSIPEDAIEPENPKPPTPADSNCCTIADR